MQKYIKYGLRRGADHVQINSTVGENVELKINDNNVSNAEVSNDCKYYVNVWVNGRRGFYFSNVLDDSVVDKALSKTVTL